MSQGITSRAVRVVAALAVSLAIALVGTGSAQAQQAPGEDGSDAWDHWAAVSAAEGCTLVDLRITEAVDAAARGPVTVVEREERCPASPARLAVAAAGSDCSGTAGPGLVCLSRSGGYVTTSFQYSGSGTITAFLKLYGISSTAGCPTGSSLATSATSSYTDGTRRSLSVYAPTQGTYSAHVWKHVGVGIYDDWGAACGVV